MSSTRPLVSIIITCYNYAAYVEEAILSALSQDYDNIEVVVVDDGSKDDSWEIISRFKDKVRAIKTENKGSVSACLTGFRASTGDYIMFLDADDALFEDAFADIGNLLGGEVSKVQFCLQPVDSKGKLISAPFPDYNKDMSNLSLISSISKHGFYTTPPTSGNVYRRDVYDSIGDISYDPGIDGVPYLLAPFMGTVISLKTPLAKYRMHGNNMTSIKKLSAQRLSSERTVFLARITHLNKLLEHHGINRQGFYPQSEYLYSIERDVYSKLFSDLALGWRLRVDYLNRVFRETAGIGRVLSLVYALLVIFLSKNLAKRLIRLRIDNSNTSPLKAFLKKNFLLQGHRA